MPSVIDMIFLCVIFPSVPTVSKTLNLLNSWFILYFWEIFTSSTCEAGSISTPGGENTNFLSIKTKPFSSQGAFSMCFPAFLQCHSKMQEKTASYEFYSKVWVWWLSGSHFFSKKVIFMRVICKTRVVILQDNLQELKKLAWKVEFKHLYSELHLALLLVVFFYQKN